MKYCPGLCNKVDTKEAFLVSRSTFLVLSLKVCGRWNPAHPARERETLNEKRETFLSGSALKSIFHGTYSFT